MSTERLNNTVTLGIKRVLTVRRLIWKALLLAALVILVLYPLIHIVLTSFGQSLGGSSSGFTVRHLDQVIFSPGEAHTLILTVVFGIGSAVTATGLGVLLAWLVVKTDLPGYRAIRLLSYLLFAIPGLLKVIGTIELFNPNSGFVWVFLDKIVPGMSLSLYSTAGMILTQGLLWTPVSFLFMASTFEQMDASFEEAASTIGVREGRIFRYISFGLARPAIAASLLLTFIAAVTSIEVPIFIGEPYSIPTVTGSMYQQFSGSLTVNYSNIAALAVILIIPVILLVFVYGSALRKGRSYIIVTGRGYRVKRSQIRGAKRYAGLFCLIIVVAMLVLPIFALVWIAFLTHIVPPTDIRQAVSALTLGQFRTAFSNPSIISSAYNTVIVSFVSASLVVMLAVATGWFVVWGKRILSRTFDFLASVPLVFPGLLTGLGVLLAYIRSPIYDTVWMFVLAYTTEFLPYAMRYVEAGYRGLSREFIEAGETCGVGSGRRVYKILLPLLWPSLTAAWMFTYLLCLQELGASLLVAGPSSPVISVAFYQATVQGSIGMVAAFGLVVALIGSLLGLLVTRLGHRALMV